MMMDIERLKELRGEVSNVAFIALSKLVDKNARANVVKFGEDLQELIDETIARQSVKSDIGETSDGYHTFNELYHHRAILFAALSKAYPDKAWKSLKHHDGTMFDDETFICGIKTPEGHYTYHYNTRYWPMFTGKILDNAPEWDGHKPEDVDRLLTLRQYQKPTDEAVQNMVQTFESFLSSGHDADWTGDTVSNQYLHDAILVALRQTRTEPCWYCKDIESHGIKSVKTVTDESDRELGAYDTPYNYCPNCGRKLEG